MESATAKTGTLPSQGYHLGRFVCRLLLCACVFVVFVYCYAQLVFGSLSNMSAYFRGSFLLAEPNVLDLGRVDLGKDYSATFTVQNVSPNSVVILGARVCCGCKLSSKMPLTVSPNEKAKVTLAMYIAADQPAGKVERLVPLLIDKGNGYGPVLTIVAKLNDPSASPGTPPKP